MELLTLLWFQAVNQSNALENTTWACFKDHVFCGSGTCPSFHQLVTIAPRRVLIVSGTFLLSNISTNVQAEFLQLDVLTFTGNATHWRLLQTQQAEGKCSHIYSLILLSHKSTLEYCLFCHLIVLRSW